MDDEYGRSRRTEMLRTLARHLNAPGRGEDLAGQACLSRYHFQRVFRQSVGEAPGGLRRRLILERAGFDLRTTEKDVTEVALEAGYRSLEGFSRAFKAAFGLAPSDYRKAARSVKLLPGTSGVHYDPDTQGLTTNMPGGKRGMDLTDRMIDSDFWSKRRILECARSLSDLQLDAPLAFRHNLLPFVEPDRTLREGLDRLSTNGWAVAMMDVAGWPTTDDRYKTNRGSAVGDMIQRLEAFHADYASFVAHVKTNDLWDKEWVDDTCEEPETFSYGTVIEGSLTWGIPHRMAIQRLLEQTGLYPDQLSLAK